MPWVICPNLTLPEIITVGPVPSIAIIGRPNVGKSRLFNRLAGRRISIVHDLPGVTRDVVTAESADGYVLMDTGGLGLRESMTSVEIQEATETQVDFAIEAANLLLFVTDGRDGLAPLDEMVADKLRRLGKKPLLVVNKIDFPEQVGLADEFSKLGFETLLRVSAEHGHGMNALLKEIRDHLGPVEPEAKPAEQRRVRIAFVGRPNVGKSSLCNRLLDADRLIVSEVPGTTRETTTRDLDYQAKDDAIWRFRLFDTAGLRRRKKIANSLEYFSSLRTEQAIEETDIALLVLDAREGVSKQDKILAGRIVEAGKALVIVVNKWDVAVEGFRRDPLSEYEDEEDFRAKYEKAARKELFALPRYPMLFVSAKTGLAIEEMLSVVVEVDHGLDRVFPTPELNRTIINMMENRPPAARKGKRFKIFYAVQTNTRPFTIRLFCNRADRLEDVYRRYLSNGLTTRFNLFGAPLRFTLTGKEARYTKKN
ncbi:MAG: ribosome biogenesis GTPase Der [Opitutales bacterium]